MPGIIANTEARLGSPRFPGRVPADHAGYRVVATHLSTLHNAAAEGAAEDLRREGAPPGYRLLQDIHVMLPTFGDNSGIDESMAELRCHTPERMMR